MVKGKVVSVISDLQTVLAASGGVPGSKTFSWTNTLDGNICLEEVSIAYDSIIQSNGNITIRIMGHTAADHISPISSASSFGFQRMETPIGKGETVVFEVTNSHASSNGTFQAIVSAYEVR